MHALLATPAGGPSREHGFTLIEALVALMIVSMVVMQFLGIRTSALVDATKARNWRLAREIAEERLSELQAGAHETRPRSGESISLEEKYRGFSYKVVLGESEVSRIESELADSAAGEDSAVGEKLTWQRDRDQYRKASQRGLSYSEYQDKVLEEDTQRRLEEQAPSETDFEEVAIVVYFPKLDPDYPDQQDSLMIKSRVSTLAISGLTPDQAATMAAQMGTGSTPAGGGSSGGSNPGGGVPGGGDGGK